MVLWDWDWDWVFKEKKLTSFYGIGVGYLKKNN